MKRLIWIVMALAALAGCGSPPPPVHVGGPELVGGGVLFRYRNASAKKVYLVGDFNDWSPTSDPMTDENGDGDWTLFYPLGPGRYAYKFVVDGKSWVFDPTNPESEPDGFDGRNSVITVPPPGK
ncbi:MAG TPA: isoamylase early set domain-containing protein [Candidatus Krumholzibacteria bacterium]|nr:isoamylase early set domain-containing protein [Candidatus Krumholzibacteria bacterium]